MERQPEGSALVLWCNGCPSLYVIKENYGIFEDTEDIHNFEQNTYF